MCHIASSIYLYAERDDDSTPTTGNSFDGMENLSASRRNSGTCDAEWTAGFFDLSGAGAGVGSGVGVGR